MTDNCLVVDSRNSAISFTLAQLCRKSLAFSLYPLNGFWLKAYKVEKYVLNIVFRFFFFLLLFSFYILEKKYVNDKLKSFNRMLFYQGESSLGPEFYVINESLEINPPELKA